MSRHDAAISSVVADEAVQRYAEACVASRVEAEIGVLVGRRAGRTSIVQLVRSPDADGAKPVSLPGGAAGAAAGKKGKAGSGGAGALRLDGEWVVEHAAQVARLLLGGLDVLGLYVLCPEASLSASAGALVGAAREVLSALREQSAPVLLHIDAVTGKLAAKECSAAGAASLKPCELKTAAVLPNLMTLRCTYDLDLELAVTGGQQVLEAALTAAVEWEVQRRLASALALLEGCLHQAEAVLMEAAGPSAAVCEMQLLTPPASAALRLAEAKAAAGVLTRGKGSFERVGVVRLQGRLDCRALVGKREAVGAAVDAIKSDIQRSLRVRLETLSDAAAAQQVAAAAEAAAAAAATKGGVAAAAPAASPLLLRPLAGTAAADLALPRRVFVDGAGGVPYCDYLVEGEGHEAVISRMGELLGLAVAGEGAVESLERLDAALGKPMPGRGAAFSACNLMAAGAAGAALLAAGIGYLTLGQ